MGAVIVFAVALLIFLLQDTELGSEITGGLAGVAILWATNFTMALNFNVIFSTDLEAKLTSLERIMEYSDLTPESSKLKNEVTKLYVPYKHASTHLMAIRSTHAVKTKDGLDMIYPGLTSSPDYH